MKCQHFAFFIIITLLASIHRLPDAEAQAPEQKIAIGFITDLSGIGSYWGKDSALGAKLAEKKLLSDGFHVSVVVGDHSFQTKNAISETEKQLSIDHIDALYVDFAPLAIATSSIAAQHKVLFLNNSAATSILESNPYAFKAYLDYEKGCHEIAKVWKANGIKKVGMLRLPLEFAELCHRGIIAVYPNVFLREYDVGEAVQTPLLWLKQKGVQAIFDPSFEGDAINLFKAMAQLHYQVPVGLSEPDGLTDQIVAQFPAQLEGAAFFGFPSVSDSFQRQVLAAEPNHSTRFLQPAAMAYTHVLQLARAIATCPTADISCEVSTMAASPSDSTMSFVSWDHRKASYDFTLKEWKHGKLSLIRTFR